MLNEFHVDSVRGSQYTCVSVFTIMSRRPIATHPNEGYHGKGAKNSLSSIPHYCLPSLNTYLMNNISDSDEAVQYYSEPENFNLPMPYVTFSEIESGISSVSNLVNLKIQWNFKNEKLLKKCREKLSKSSLNNIKKTAQKKKSLCTKIPRILSHFTENLMENPDQYFDSDYNWYFKNTIDKFKIDGKWYLAYARGVNLDILDIISIEDNELGILKTTKDTFFKGSIFDIRTSNINNELMIRQKTKLFIFWNNSNVEFLLNENSIIDNCDVPFADSDITTNNFCSVDVNQIIKLWEKGYCVQDKHFNVVSNQTDKFMHISYLQNQTDLMGIIDRQKFYFIDSRIDISKPCSIYDPSILIENCEELTALKSSTLNSHSFYVTSNHSVLTLDKRMGFVHKSCHMLSNSPSLIASHIYENSLEPNEMLFLGNQTEESLVYLSYTSFQDDFLIGRHMPTLIPKPLDTLHNVRLQGHCLNPILIDRFSRCLIGTTAVGECRENLRLFSVNSAGDLFVQTIDDNRSIDVIEFKKKVTIKPQLVPKLNYSDLFDMSKLLHLELPKTFNENVQKKNVWSMSKEKMTSYVDHLAPLILSPWDIDDLSEWENEDENDEAVNDDSDCDYTTKIHFWFNKNDLLLGSSEVQESNMCNTSINFSSQASTSKAPPMSENDDDSSLGFTVSIKSNE